jgi:hypothetical protein
MNRNGVKYPRRSLSVLLNLLLFLSVISAFALGTAETEKDGPDIEDERNREEQTKSVPAQEMVKGEAATADDPAAVVPVLVSGPNYKEGLPFFPPNVIGYYAGIYEMSDRRVAVYFTERDIVPHSAWGERACGRYRLQTFQQKMPEELEKEIESSAAAAVGSPAPPAAAGGSIPFFYYDGGSFHLFFGFIGKEVSCPFVESFIKNYLYFRGVSGGKEGMPQFPAVLDDMR